MTGSGPGPINYRAIAQYEHARWAEIRQYAGELDERASRTVDQQAKELLDQLGLEKLQRIAAHRAWRWASLAGTTEFPENRDYYFAKSQAWQRHADNLDLRAE